MNGVYLRELQPDEYAHFLCKWLTEQGIEWPQDTRARDRAARAGEDREVLAVPGLRAVPLRGRVAGRRAIRRSVAAALERLETVEPWEATAARGSACARWPMSSARSRATRSRRSGSRSPARRSRPGSSRASSCSVATGRSHVCAPLAPARLSERLRRRERVEGPLEAPPGLEAIVRGRARELARRDRFRRRLHAHGREGDLPFLMTKTVAERCWLRPVGEARTRRRRPFRPPRRATHRSSRPQRTRRRRRARAGTRRAAVRLRRGRPPRRPQARAGGATRSRASRTRKRAPRHSCSNGSTPAAPQIDTASATSAVESRAQRSASASSACAVRAAAGGASPYASSLARCSAYCRRRSERHASSSSSRTGSPATLSRRVIVRASPVHSSPSASA